MPEKNCYSSLLILSSGVTMQRKFSGNSLVKTRKRLLSIVGDVANVFVIEDYYMVELTFELREILRLVVLCSACRCLILNKSKILILRANSCQ